MKTIIIISSIVTGLLIISFFSYNKKWLKTTIYTLILAILFCPLSGILGYNLGIFNNKEIVKECSPPNCPTFEECINPKPCPEMEVVYQQDEALFLCQEVFKENEELKTTNEELETEIGLLELAQKTDKEKMNELEIEKNECWQKNYKCQEQLKILIN